MENNNFEQRSIPILRIIYKNLLIIIMATVLAGLLGWGYSILKDKTVYTASYSIVFRAEISSSSSSNGQNAQNTASLGKIYIPMVEGVIKSPEMGERINVELQNKSGYEQAVAYISSIGLSYADESLIFNLSYSDWSAEAAKAKLDAVYDVASRDMHEFITAKDVSFIKADNKVNISQRNNFNKNIIFGAAIGLFLSVGAVFLIYFLDNTVRDKKEFEEITGVDVIAMIEKEKKRK